ncbi:hypothetical protein Tco_0145332 [Tanacetum coccineum]
MKNSPPSKTSPLMDDDLDEEEAIKEIEKKNLENIAEDETLEIDEIVNIKESMNHPLENVIGNLICGLVSEFIVGLFLYACVLDLSPLSLSFDFVLFSVRGSLNLYHFRLDCLCHLAFLLSLDKMLILCIILNACYNSLDRLDIFEGRSCISEFVRKSLSLILELS